MLPLFAYSCKTLAAFSRRTAFFTLIPAFSKWMYDSGTVKDVDENESTGEI